MGRIVRQGNRNPEVNITRFVKEGTFDSYMYQLIENKQKFIAQIMTSKTPVRVAEDVDETALSYAEIKALATGNPLIIEKCQLELEVNRLKILEASHRSQRYALEDKIAKEYPQEIKRLTEQITGYKADMETVAQHPVSADHFPPMKIEGILYAEKKAAGSALLAACSNMKSSDPIELGHYRGFDMALSSEGFSKQFKVTLFGKRTHSVGLGNDVFGNITRIDNELAGFAEDLARCERNLESTEKQLQSAKDEVSRPFPQEQEYTEKAARLRELDILLGMGERDNTVLDAEPDERDAVPERTTKARNYEPER